ncbi:DNA-(apurinic or apyrimidinic site) lyase /Formamidopyrimidine-DNA glycosylase [Stackebrandtia albiflava]|uniref:DNA-(Apurinic or apyrimidinic site) lyase /Formamidopyrimidine-DNA glycosylase n=1 Tax=Stackebrandtia albiflava TaxID=406432 RepID=A0A562UL44_9ACTN|nr:DNA-formamidopyrimidine glycosylase family protein [Stackebrandtia albiflava]TWJ06338.1 DNA-(apurinic or apyrimidinic site) lyase /Formamidopyrimidine-DNA glycosylase [Stackebrandtia albiflava]
MPELPEVAALAGFLSRRATGHRVTRVDVASIQVLKTFDPPPTALTGRALTAVDRHGKFLDLDFDGLHLVVHMARAGWLRWREELPAAPLRPGKGLTALRLVLDDGSGFDLTEAGTRKRLAAYVVADPATVPGVAALGVEPLSPDFTLEAFTALLAGRRQQIKGVLRDQRLVAGIGNAYSDEVLHAARLSPYKLADALTPEEVERLHRAIRDTLAEAVAESADLAAGQVKAHKKELLRVHGKAGRPCPVCGDTIREVSFADSSLQYCPTCQTGGKPLADRRMSRLLK